jgi:hypothetical protein
LKRCRKDVGHHDEGHRWRRIVAGDRAFDQPATASKYGHAVVGKAEAETEFALSRLLPPQTLDLGAS